MTGRLKLVPDVHTSSRLSQDSAALWSGGISGSWTWLCLPNPGTSPVLSSVWQLLDAQLDEWVAGGDAGAGWGLGLECKRRKSCAAADALSLTGLMSASRASASSARTRVHSFSISLMLALSCCRGADEENIFQFEWQWGVWMWGRRDTWTARRTSKPVVKYSRHCQNKNMQEKKKIENVTRQTWHNKSKISNLYGNSNISNHLNIKHTFSLWHADTPVIKTV